MRVGSHKDLEVWKLGVEIADLVYQIMEGFPTREHYGLASHMRRTSVSIPSNVAEGYARVHWNECRQFCYMSRGSSSSAELETQLIITRRRGFVSEDDHDALTEHLDHESRMLTSLTQRLKGK